MHCIADPTTRRRGQMAGNPVHFEVPAGDTGRSQQFWGSLFGWQFQSMEGPMEYHMGQINDQAGVATFPADDGGRGIRVYFDVEDVNDGIARVKELGGKAEDAAPVPGHGWFALCEDTEGNEFALWQNDSSAGGAA
jgi:uncharacterized protein